MIIYPYNTSIGRIWYVILENVICEVLTVLHMYFPPDKRS